MSKYTNRTGTSGDVRHTGAWQRLRIQALNRDHWLCRWCLGEGRLTPATEVHHLIPVETDPSRALDLDNLVSLCRVCHEGTKQRGAPKPSAPAGVRVIRG